MNRVDHENFKRLTHDDMKNHFLSGDKIDVTSRGEVDDFELDRMQGMDGMVHNMSEGDSDDDQIARADSLVELPIEHNKI